MLQMSRYQIIFLLPYLWNNESARQEQESRMKIDLGPKYKIIVNEPRRRREVYTMKRGDKNRC
jgi:hypothetical protein